jgi:hypothetical protein
VSKASLPRKTTVKAKVEIVAERYFASSSAKEGMNPVICPLTLNIGDKCVYSGRSRSLLTQTILILKNGGPPTKLPD